MESVYTALIVAVPAVLSPLLLSWLTNRHRRQEKFEDYERQDLVAAKAEEAARLLLAANERVAEATKETNEKLVDVAKVTGVIHTLVNSQLTGSKQSEFNAITRELALLQEIGGSKPSERIRKAIKIAETSLAELAAVLADRATAAKQVEIQQRANEKI